MSTQWHPLFAHLLSLLIGEHYEVKPEEPVSDLPRRGDLLVIRRQSEAAPPYRGLWSHLTDWNVFEYKGPSDAAEEDDLELLMHVGAGLTYRLNEERRERKESRLGNRQMSFWYLAPNLGETFLGHARTRVHLTYETNGLWRGVAWGHPIWLVAYRDAPVEVDTIPLHLLGEEHPLARPLGEFILQRQELLLRFGAWLGALQPALWKEIEFMANTASGGPRIDWETVSRFPGFDECIRLLPPGRIIQMMGVHRAVEAIGLSSVIAEVGVGRVIAEVGVGRVIAEIGLKLVIAEVGLKGVIAEVGLKGVIEEVGLKGVIEEVGAERVIETLGLEKLLAVAFPDSTPEQIQELLRQQRKG